MDIPALLTKTMSEYWMSLPINSLWMKIPCWFHPPPTHPPVTACPGGCFHRRLVDLYPPLNTFPPSSTQHPAFINRLSWVINLNTIQCIQNCQINSTLSIRISITDKQWTQMFWFKSIREGPKMFDPKPSWLSHLPGLCKFIHCPDWVLRRTKSLQGSQ